MRVCLIALFICFVVMSWTAGMSLSVRKKVGSCTMFVQDAGFEKIRTKCAGVCPGSDLCVMVGWPNGDVTCQCQTDSGVYYTPSSVGCYATLPPEPYIPDCANLSCPGLCTVLSEVTEHWTEVCGC